MDCGIVLAYFSPCNFKLLRQHAIAALSAAIASGAPVSFAEVVQPGQVPLEVPPGLYSHQVFESSDIMFYKENLWNLAARKLNTEKLLFLDADVYYRDSDWLQKISAALNTFDVIQPYEWAHWEDRAGEVIRIRPAVFRLAAANKTRGVGFSPATHHTGFGIGIKAAAYEKLGGIFEGAMAGGGGDVSFTFAFADAIADRLFFRRYATDWAKCFFSPAYVKYRNRALSFNFEIGVVADLKIYHRWHGTIKNRQYINRHSYFCDYVLGKNPPVYRRADGLLQWTTPQPNAINYFKSRREDDAQ